MDNPTYHYPPELFELLCETIPCLGKSKESTVQFFKNAGVRGPLIDTLWAQVKRDRDSIKKHEISRQLLTEINERGDAGLRDRRELLKRVVEFDDFGVCWERDRYKAEGLVSKVQKLVNAKDTFTRIKDERESDRRQHREEQQALADAKLRHQEQLDLVKTDLFALFGESNPQKRGKQLEAVLNRLFQASGVLVRDAFELVGDSGEGVIEQVDGVIELDGELYFVEMKWWKDPLGVPQISEHMMRVMSRYESRAIILSASGFGDPAIAACKAALHQKVVTLCTLEEIVLVLERKVDLASFLRKKVHTTIIDKTPFARVAVG